jgi:AraC-like DNA-binding protein
MVIGPWTEPFVANLPAGTNILGARCHPGLASGLLGMPASELLNRSVPLCEVWGSGADTDRFARIAEETTLSSRMLAMEAAVLGRLANARPVDKMTKEAVRWMAEHPNRRVERLSKWLGIGNRQLQRRFVVSAGYGPKMFQCILRFQRLMNEARRSDGRVTLVELATRGGYSDQAHMTREVLRFANCSPASFLRRVSSTLSMSDLFKTGHTGTN